MKKATTPASSPTKPTKPNTPTKKSLSQASPLGNIADELSENPFVVWPEWVDAEVAAEKWNTKHTFEDPDGQIVLPKSIRNSVETSKRIMELSETTPVGIAQNVLETVFQSQQQNNSGMAGSAGTSAPARQTPDNFPIEAQSELSPSSDPLDLNSSVSSSDAPQDVNTISNTAENTISSLKSNSVSLNELDIEEKPITPKVNTTQQENESENDSFSGASQFFLANRHLLGSELIRQILCTLHFIYEQAEQSRQNRPSNTSAVAGIEEAFPWEFIYPKGKDGLPIYNISGKYMVKLYWLGAWRKITVDDRIPVDSLGKPLVITSPFLHELWPMILCKALIKVASTSYKEIDGACEYGDFDILTAMRGWIPERFLLNPSKQDKYLWKTLNTLNLKSQQSNNASNSGSASDKNTSQKSSAPTSSAKVEKGTSSRPSMSSQVVQNAIVHVFAIKDTDELGIVQDLTNGSYLIRVMEVKDSDIKLKTYFGCGNKTKAGGKVTVKDDSEMEVLTDDGSEFWISYKEFCSKFKCITVFHNQTLFKFSKTIQNIVDPSKPNDQYKIPNVIYLPENMTESNVIISLQTFGRVSDGNTQVSSAFIEKKEICCKRSQGERNQVLRISTNSCSSGYCKIKQGRHVYKIFVDCQTSYVVSILSKDEFLFEEEGKYATERLGMVVKDVDDVLPAQSPNSWSLLFKYTFNIPEGQPTIIKAVVYVPGHFEQSTCVRLFNNDGPAPGTSKEAPQAFFYLKPQLCYPSKNGYTLLADFKSPVPKLATKWKLRVFSDIAFMFLSPEKPLEGLSIKPIVQDFEDVYVPTKHNIIFRYIIRVKDASENNVSMQLSFNIPYVSLRLQLFDYDNEIFSEYGKGVITIHSVNFYSNQPDGDVAQVTTGKASKDQAKQAANTALPKHKYILQASMEPVELTKFTPTVGVSAVDANRSSRNALKPATSAKKKKPAVATAVPIIDERTAQVGQSTGSSDPSWKIRFISTDTASLIVLKDTEKEDRYKALKETWEQSQPGRASKARDARDNFIKQVEQGAIKPLTLGLNLKNPCKPWTIMNNSLKSRQTTDHPSPTQSSSSSIYVSSRPASARFFSNDARPNSAGGAFKNEPNLFDSIDESSLNGSALGVSVNWPSALGPHVLTPDEVTSKVDIREKSLLEQLQIQEDIRKRREKEKEKRAVIKVHQATVLDQKFKENEPIIRWDLDRRDTYKQSVLKQLEDALAKKAADAARLAEEQGLLNAEDNEREKKKKGAKTRT